MKTKKTLLLILLTINTIIYSQNNKKFFLLAETGVQTINNNINFNLGAGIEHFFTKKSSLTFRIKYLKTSIESENGNTSNTGFGFTSFYKMLYTADIISIPLNYKWESPFIFPKLHFFF